MTRFLSVTSYCLFGGISGSRVTGGVQRRTTPPSTRSTSPHHSRAASSSSWSMLEAGRKASSANTLSHGVSSSSASKSSSSTSATSRNSATSGTGSSEASSSSRTSSVETLLVEQQYQAATTRISGDVAPDHPGGTLSNIKVPTVPPWRGPQDATEDAVWIERAIQEYHQEVKLEKPAAPTTSIASVVGGSAPTAPILANVIGGSTDAPPVALISKDEKRNEADVEKASDSASTDVEYASAVESLRKKNDEEGVFLFSFWTSLGTQRRIEPMMDTWMRKIGPRQAVMITSAFPSQQEENRRLIREKRKAGKLPHRVFAPLAGHCQPRLRRRLNYTSLTYNDMAFYAIRNSIQMCALPFAVQVASRIPNLQFLASCEDDHYVLPQAFQLRVENTFSTPYRHEHTLNKFLPIGFDAGTRKALLLLQEGEMEKQLKSYRAGRFGDYAHYLQDPDVDLSDFGIAGLDDTQRRLVNTRMMGAKEASAFQNIDEDLFYNADQNSFQRQTRARPTPSMDLVFVETEDADVKTTSNNTHVFNVVSKTSSKSSRKKKEKEKLASKKQEEEKEKIPTEEKQNSNLLERERSESLVFGGASRLSQDPMIMGKWTNEGCLGGVCGPLGVVFNAPAVRLLGATFSYERMLSRVGRWVDPAAAPKAKPVTSFLSLSTSSDANIDDIKQAPVLSESSSQGAANLDEQELSLQLVSQHTAETEGWHVHHEPSLVSKSQNELPGTTWKTEKMTGAIGSPVQGSTSAQQSQLAQSRVHPVPLPQQKPALPQQVLPQGSSGLVPQHVFSSSAALSQQPSAFVPQAQPSSVLVPQSPAVLVPQAVSPGMPQASPAAAPPRAFPTGGAPQAPPRGVAPQALVPEATSGTLVVGQKSNVTPASQMANTGAGAGVPSSPGVPPALSAQARAGVPSSPGVPPALPAQARTVGFIASSNAQSKAVVPQTSSSNAEVATPLLTATSTSQLGAPGVQQESPGGVQQSSGGVHLLSENRLALGTGWHHGNVDKGAHVVAQPQIAPQRAPAAQAHLHPLQASSSLANTNMKNMKKKIGPLAPASETQSHQSSQNPEKTVPVQESKQQQPKEIEQAQQVHPQSKQQAKKTQAQPQHQKAKQSKFSKVKPQQKQDKKQREPAKEQKQAQQPKQVQEPNKSLQTDEKKGPGKQGQPQNQSQKQSQPQKQSSQPEKQSSQPQEQAQKQVQQQVDELPRLKIGQFGIHSVLGWMMKDLARAHLVRLLEQPALFAEWAGSRSSVASTAKKLPNEKTVIFHYITPRTKEAPKIFDAYALDELVGDHMAKNLPAPKGNANAR
ncbi:unnamed protein product [Amoebophrya sp. A25]|nr:unnamed protein product [Amoebophrya sp. A25]|eukprot:GSA25T00017710001.1